MKAKSSAPRIFIVEDEALIACALEGQVCALGYEVSGVAADAETAFKAMTGDPPDVLLTDINLGPGANGISLAARCRERLGVGVVFLTGYDDSETFASVAKVQSYSFILKPYSERDLRVSLEIALYRRSVEAELLSYRQNLEGLVGTRTSELQESNRRLEEALAQVKRLSGLISICMYCHRMRDERQVWLKLEEYISAHSDADFSHGLCPDCYRVKILK